MDAKTILIVGAHMDDCEIGAGGLIAKAVRKGHRVVLVNVASDYSSWFRTQGREEEIRAKVVKKAEEIGVEKRFLGYPYQQVPTDIDAIRKVAEVVIDVRPDITLYHHPFDRNPSDHGTVSYITDRAVRDATRLLDNYVSFSQETYTYEVYPYFPEFQPDTFIDITDVIGEVMQWPNYFDEIYQYPGPRASVKFDVTGDEEISLWTHGEMKMVTAAFRGWQSGVRFAEAYTNRWRGAVGKSLLPSIVE